MESNKSFYFIAILFVITINEVKGNNFLFHDSIYRDSIFKKRNCLEQEELLYKNIIYLFNSSKYIEVNIKINEFLEKYPNSNYVEQMYYFKAKSYLKQASKLPRDLSGIKKAKKIFVFLSIKFPKNKLTKESKENIRYINNILADKDMSIARYYLTLNNTTAAVIILKYIERHYSNTPYFPEVIYRLYSIYYNIGLNSIAIHYYKILEKKYTETIWYKKIVA